MDYRILNRSIMVKNSVMITILSGGTGTPKLIEGLRHIIKDDKLTIIANTSDDFWWNGLYISPDVDTLIYLFTNILDTKKYWGIKGDTFNFLSQAKQYGIEQEWFNIGDRDLAIHVIRTYLLRKGYRLHEVVSYILKKLKINAKILPMSNNRISTYVYTDKGKMGIQEFLVKYEGKPEVFKIEFLGIEEAKPAPGVIESILNAEAIIIGPSNPINSIGPIISIKEVKHALVKSKAPKVAISPIISGKPLSGPADKFMKAMGYDVSPLGVIEVYREFINGIIIDKLDIKLTDAIRKNYNVEVATTNTIMRSLNDKISLAKETLKLAWKIKEKH